MFRWIQRKQTEAGLAQQAVDIAAHRQAQRAETPVAPAAPVTAATAAAEAKAPAVSPLAWTTSWSDFRGARRDGHYGGPIRTDWTALKPLWRQPIGAGFASFVAANGHAFTIEQRGDEEVAAAYDILTGRELWTNAWKASFVENMGGPGPRATPTVHDGTLFVLGATGELRAIDAANGQLRWRTNIVDDAGGGNREYGLAASPLVAGNVVITVPGGGDGRSVVAYDRATGRMAWSALDDEGAYTSPVRATIAGVDQIVLLLASRVVAVSPDRGAVLWQFPWNQGGNNNAAQPVVIGDNKVFVSSGFGGMLLEVTRDGRGLTATDAWQSHRMKNDFTSSVYHDGFIYGIDLGILACIDASTGELKWKGGRYGNGQTLVASGHLVITTGDGEVVLVRATPESHQELARVPALDDRMWNHPAIADGFLLVRNAAQMAAFDLRVR
jgi:outer membrane protein assembly factor BamB